MSTSSQPSAAFALLAVTGVALPGCIGAFAVEEITSFDERRQGLVLVAESEHLEAYARPESPAALHADADLEFLEPVLRYYVSRLGPWPTDKLALYLHHGSVSNAFVSFAGVAHDDGTTDIEWTDYAEWRHKVEAHELAHLVLDVAVGSNPRPFLEEGMAEHLSATYPIGYTESGFLGPTTFSARDQACATNWFLEDLLVGASFHQGRAGPDHGYALAALFTEIAIDQLGMVGYLDRLYLPGGRGTTADVERLLRATLGTDLPGMELRVRRLAASREPISCSRTRPCPGRCRCPSPLADYPPGECVP